MSERNLKRIACAAVLMAFMSSSPSPGGQSLPTAANDAVIAETIRNYCGNVGVPSREMRMAAIVRQLADAEQRLTARLGEFEAKEQRLREWISKRKELEKAATDELVAIYAKIRPEIAAEQLIAINPATAAAILSKLNPRLAGAILNEMSSTDAARLASLIAPAEKKSKS